VALESNETGRGRLERFTKKLHSWQDSCPKYWYYHQKRQGTSVMAIDLSDGWKSWMNTELSRVISI